MCPTCPTCLTTNSRSIRYLSNTMGFMTKSSHRYAAKEPTCPMGELKEKAKGACGPHIPPTNCIYINIETPPSFPVGPPNIFTLYVYKGYKRSCRTEGTTTGIHIIFVFPVDPLVALYFFFFFFFRLVSSYFLFFSFILSFFLF